jgi:hypothetical protein
MPTRRDIRDAKIAKRISRIEAPKKIDLARARRADLAAIHHTMTQRVIDQTENIKQRKAARLPNIEAMRERKNLRIAQGRGLLVGSRVADSYDRSVAAGATVLTDEDFTNTVRAAQGKDIRVTTRKG